jgi:hypothetical protein
VDRHASETFMNVRMIGNAWDHCIHISWCPSMVMRSTDIVYMLAEQDSLFCVATAYAVYLY